MITISQIQLPLLCQVLQGILSLEPWQVCEFNAENALQPPGADGNPALLVKLLCSREVGAATRHQIDEAFEEVGSVRRSTVRIEIPGAGGMALGLNAAAALQSSRAQAAFRQIALTLLNVSSVRNTSKVQDGVFVARCHFDLILAHKHVVRIEQASIGGAIIDVHSSSCQHRHIVMMED